MCFISWSLHPDGCVFQEEQTASLILHLRSAAAEELERPQEAGNCIHILCWRVLHQGQACLRYGEGLLDGALQPAQHS